MQKRIIRKNKNEISCEIAEHSRILSKVVIKKLKKKQILKVNVGQRKRTEKKSKNLGFVAQKTKILQVSARIIVRH